MKRLMIEFGQAAVNTVGFILSADKGNEMEREDNRASDIVVSVEQMRRSDAYTIEHYTSGRELMHRAAYGVYDSYQAWKGKQVAIAAGGGNNGGDGYALAGILKKSGYDPIVYRVSEKTA